MDCTPGSSSIGILVDSASRDKKYGESESSSLARGQLSPRKPFLIYSGLLILNLAGKLRNSHQILTFLGAIFTIALKIALCGDMDNPFANTINKVDRCNDKIEEMTDEPHGNLKRIILISRKKKMQGMIIYLIYRGMKPLSLAIFCPSGPLQ
jgi:hypothetical protein